MQMKTNALRQSVRRFFEGETQTDNSGSATQQQNQANPQQQQQQAAAQQQQNPTQQERTYTQSEFDKLFNSKTAEEKRKFQAQNQQTVKQLEELKQNQSLTQKEKEELQQRIDELTATYRTAEEVKKSEIEKLNKKFNDTKTTLEQERDGWKNRFEKNTIRVDIANASVKYNAVSPEQIEAFLTPITRCVEVMDDAGKPTGKYTSKVKFEDFDAEGKPISMDLDVDAAVKLMRERTTRFGNLFKNITNGGTGSLVNNNPGNGAGNLDINRMSPSDYKKNRENIHAQLRAQQAKA